MPKRPREDEKTPDSGAHKKLRQNSSSYQDGTPEAITLELNYNAAAGERLAQGVREGKADVVESALNQGANPGTPIHAVSDSSELDFLDETAMSKDCMTAAVELYLAEAKGDTAARLKIIELLAEANRDKSILDCVCRPGQAIEGHSPLLLAVIHGDVALMRVLIATKKDNTTTEDKARVAMAALPQCDRHARGEILTLLCDSFFPKSEHISEERKLFLTEIACQILRTSLTECAEGRAWLSPLPLVKALIAAGASRSNIYLKFWCPDLQSDLPYILAWNTLKEEYKKEQKFAKSLNTHGAITSQSSSQAATAASAAAYSAPLAHG